MPGIPDQCDIEGPLYGKGRLIVRSLHGHRVLSPDVDVTERILQLRAHIAEWDELAEAASTDDAGRLRLRAHGGRRRLAALEWIARAQREGRHLAVLLDARSDEPWSICACGVMVAGQLGIDFTEEEFQDAIGHLPLGTATHGDGNRDSEDEGTRS